MAPIMSVLNFYLKTYKRYMFIITVFVLFILASIFAYYRYAKPALSIEQLTMQSDIANMKEEQTGKALIYFFHADWCPHCTKAQPTWNLFSGDYNKKTIKGTEIECVDVNCTDDNDKKVQKLISTYNIQSYPTIVMVKDGTTIVFDGRITEDSLKQFVESVIE